MSNSIDKPLYKNCIELLDLAKSQIAKLEEPGMNCFKMQKKMKKIAEKSIHLEKSLRLLREEKKDQKVVGA